MLRLVLALLFSLGFASLAAAQRPGERVALVIGNAGYVAQTRLINPPNDAADIAGALTGLGFGMTRLNEATYDTMRRGLQDFAAAARGAEMAVVFFAGHGIEIGGENWLVPVDAALKSDQDVAFEAIPLRNVLATVAGARTLGLVILDACRNDPFRPKMAQSAGIKRSVKRGLEAVEPGGILVAYSASAGTVAADGTGRNSPFTAALLRHIATPDLDINFVFRRVRDEVRRATGNQQEPALYGSLGGDMIALATRPKEAGVVAPDPDAAARADFAIAQAIGTVAGWDAFLGRHATGFFAEIAKAERARVAGVAAAGVPQTGLARANSVPSIVDRPSAPSGFMLPEGAKLIPKLEQSGPIEAVAFSPDGRTALSGGSGTRVRLWDVATGREIRAIIGHSAIVSSVAFSPDGRVALSGGNDKSVRLWDVATGHEILAITGHSDWVRSVAFSPDGRTALSGGADETVRLWDVWTRREIGPFVNQFGLINRSGSVNSVAFSPDGRTALSGGNDMTLRLWDVATRRETRAFAGHSAWVSSVAFSPDGRVALSGGADKTVRLWDVATGREIRVFAGHSGSVRSVAFSPDGGTALSGGGATRPSGSGTWRRAAKSAPSPDIPGGFRRWRSRPTGARRYREAPTAQCGSGKWRRAPCSPPSSPAPAAQSPIGRTVPL